ncbi:restriction endonuclease subunit S [Citrobacter rodentium]|uniref:Type I restriction-modification system,specificity (S) subunit n=2 Tax=Citrobacter rodentium TaxID=67825 RepID=D2TPV5_CITRI|nr:restriction endonuclease subunit S [Citrobacter rodentium]QBY29801.1 restriction endonuclease subunit S [Citrobacter rodentium]UHO32808.1 restriction endonuclease subunit S [Citrobacter rodentium NBRC 105723 = DSM 16636]CBG90140.1 putative Type I restriction-modification system,specificity (S) subunit [Citrobacter rodentium ICC168]HAT8013703.1 restriction endonuclease subunit S [Citrobacter rodentium NBRC 105723 = DSM 16636]HAT8018782.1 restriction endonuclease subunit S [Citrobacter rodent
MAKYKAYPEYKDSGVEWLGEIPIHWKMLRHKYVAFFTKGKNPTNLLEQPLKNTLPYLSMECLRNNTTDKYALISNDVRVALEGQPLVIWDGSNAGEFLKGKSGILSSTMAAATLIYPLHSQYYWYLCISIEPEMRKNAVGMGIPHVNGDELRSISFGIPSIYEQKQVADFLDHETAKIDNLIEKQQQLIELLKEKRQAVISHAVTKGLNPDVPMKDSGVEWLGDVPEHWRVSRIKNYAKIESGHTPSRTKPEYWISCNIPWVSLNDSKQLKEIDYIEDTFYKISELGMANSSAHLLPARAVVFTRDASIGLSAITTKSMAVSQHLIAWICDEKFIIPEFLLLVFYAMEKEFERYTFGATIKTIGMDNVRGLKSTFPPVEEQRNLIDWAFSKIEKIKSSINKVEDMLSLLQERRTALISAAVTGKIDVRDWVAPDTQDIEIIQEAIS